MVFPSRLLNSFAVVRRRHRERERERERERAPNPIREFLQILLVLVLLPIVVLLRHQIFPLFCGRSRFFGAAIYIFLQVILAGECTSVFVCASGFRKTVRQRESTGLREREGLRFVCFLCCFSDQDCGAWICSKLCSRLHSFLSSC